MTIEHGTSECTAEYLLEYLTKTYGGSEGEFGLEVDNDRGYMLVDGVRAEAVQFSSDNKIPPVGFTRVDDVTYNGMTYRCYISNQRTLS